jgi:hypothetical protein
VDTELTLRQREVFVAIVINDWQALDRFLQTGPRDVGCAEAMEVLHVYADLVAEGTEAEERYPGIAACGPCSEDFEALLAVRDTTP